MSGSHDGAVNGADPIDAALKHAHHVLPDQGPIGVFVHHNTLHAFQHLSFHDGVQQGAATLRAKPYLFLEQFRQAWEAGRIDDEDVDAEIDGELGARGDEVLALGLRRRALWRALMIEDVDLSDGAGLAFAIDAGTTPIAKMLPLWRACLARVARGPARPLPRRSPPMRHRDALVTLGAADTDEAVHAELVRLSAGFLDQGQAQAVLPERSRGFLAAVGALHQSGAPVAYLCRPADRDLADALQRGTSARALVEEALAALGVEHADVESFLLASALALPGWAGMFSRLERHPDDDRAEVKASLLEFLAVRVACERRAVERACRDAALPVGWTALRALAERQAARDERVDAHVLFHVARAAGAGADAVGALPDDGLAQLWREVEGCTALTRRRLWHEAYERRYRRQILDGVAALRSAASPHAEKSAASPARPEGQFVFCIDEREEAIRRALEEGFSWVPFEPNKPTTWQVIRLQAESFLEGLWQKGMLVGASPSQAFFVQCAGETNAPDVVAEGRLVCEIGVAPVAPAEFMMVSLVQEMAT